MAWFISAGAARISSPRASAKLSSSGKWLPRSWKKSRASSFGSSMRRPEGSAMPEESSRATRQARYSASTPRAAFGAEAAMACTSPSGIVSRPRTASDSTSRSPASSWRSAWPESAARSTPSASVSLISTAAVTARWSCSMRFR